MAAKDASNSELHWVKNVVQNDSDNNIQELLGTLIAVVLQFPIGLAHKSGGGVLILMLLRMIVT